MSDAYEPAKCENCQHESGKISWPPVGSTVKCSHCGHEEMAKSLVNFEDIMLDISMIDKYTDLFESAACGKTFEMVKGIQAVVDAVRIDISLETKEGDAIVIPANADLSMLQAAVNKYKNRPMKIVDGSKSSMSMGENVGWIEGSHDAVTAVRDILIAGEGHRKDISSLGAGLRSITIECAKLIEENDELRNQLGKANKKLSGDFNIAVDEQEKNRKIGRDNWKLKQLFIDLTFCYLNPEMSKTLYADTNKEFKEIVGDDPEFIDNTESES